jgi:predicted GNAT family N-acyltransferase
MKQVLQHTKDQYVKKAKIIYLKADNVKLVEFYAKLGFDVVTSAVDTHLPEMMRRVLDTR